MTGPVTQQTSMAGQRGDFKLGLLDPSLILSPLHNTGIPPFLAIDRLFPQPPVLPCSSHFLATQMAFSSSAVRSWKGLQWVNRLHVTEAHLKGLLPAYISASFLQISLTSVSLHESLFIVLHCKGRSDNHPVTAHEKLTTARRPGQSSTAYSEAVRCLILKKGQRGLFKNN